MSGGFLLILAIMFAFMYLLLIRPQRQQQRRHAEMVENLRVGDEIITAGGIYGDVTGVEPDRITVEIAEDVEIEVAKRAIATVVPPEDAVDSDEVEPEPDQMEPTAADEPPTGEERVAQDRAGA